MAFEALEREDLSNTLDIIKQKLAWSDLRRWSENKPISLPTKKVEVECKSFDLGATVEVQQSTFSGKNISDIRNHLETMTNGRWYLEAVYERRVYLYRVNSRLVTTNIHFEIAEDAALFKCVWC